MTYAVGMRTQREKACSVKVDGQFTAESSISAGKSVQTISMEDSGVLYPDLDETYTEACYWAIKPEDYLFRDNEYGQMRLSVKSLSGADLYMLEGSSSRNVTNTTVVDSGLPLQSGAPVIVPLSYSALIVMQRQKSVANGSFEI